MENKKVPYFGKEDLEGLKWTARVIEFGVGLEVSAAFNEMTVATVLLRERENLYRHKVKHYCNAANDSARRQEADIKRYMVNKKFWEDYSDHIIDAAKTDAAMFRIAIKQTLDDVRYPHSELVSYMETARCLLDMSVYQFDICMEESRGRFGRDYSACFSEYRAGDVAKKWSAMCNLLYGSSSVSVNLNSERATMAFDVLCKKFSDGRYVSECLTEAQREQPDFCNDIIVRD